MNIADNAAAEHVRLGETQVNVHLQIIRHNDTIQGDLTRFPDGVLYEEGEEEKKEVKKRRTEVGKEDVRRQ